MLNVADEWLALLFLVWDVLIVDSDTKTGRSPQSFVTSSLPLYKYWDRSPYMLPNLSLKSTPHSTACVFQKWNYVTKVHGSIYIVHAEGCDIVFFIKSKSVL